MPARKFTYDGILDATAAEVLQRADSVTVGDVSRRLGAPSGSIYHRFQSREELLVRLWLRSIRRFHRAYLAAGDHGDPEEAILAMAVCVATFTADNPADAAAMSLYRQSRLVDAAPEPCRADVRNVNTELVHRLGVLAEQRYRKPDSRQRTLVRVAAIDSPYGLVRPYVGSTVPPWLPDVVSASSRAILALGDEAH